MPPGGGRRRHARASAPASRAQVWTLGTAVAGYEHFIDTAIGIAEDAVADRPARLAQVKRLRLHVQLKLAGITDQPIDLDELGSTVRVLGRLAETELRVPGLSGGAEALLNLVERFSAPRPASDDRPLTFVALRSRH